MLSSHLFILFSCYLTTSSQEYTILNGDSSLSKYKYRYKRLSDTSHLNTNTTDDVTPDERKYCDDKNATECVVDNHKYYKAIFTDETSSWIELKEKDGVQKIDTSNATDSQMGVKVAFNSTKEFLYYGIPLEELVIYTGGFCGHPGVPPPYVTMFQYISPLMEWFSPNGTEESGILYLNNDVNFVVQWEKMQIYHNPEAGNFTFQLQLNYQTNDIFFIYKSIPTMELSDSHNHNMGLSDTYETKSGNHRMIVAYHATPISLDKIDTNKTIRFVHQKLCPMIKDCYNCTTEDLADFQCSWCSKTRQCMDTDKLDRSANTWIMNYCHELNTARGEKCTEYCYLPAPTNTTTYTPLPDTPYIPADAAGGSTLRINCSEGFAVSHQHKLTAGETYACTSGGINVPSCGKECKYTTSPKHGSILGPHPNQAIRPDAVLKVTCDKGYKLRNEAERNVTCLEEGVLEPNPDLIECSKYCIIDTHLHNATLTRPPGPVDPGFLHEGDVVTMTCKDNYVFEDFYHNKTQQNEVALICADNGEDFTSLEDKHRCVGYCNVAEHPNTTYTPQIAMIGDPIRITCTGGSYLPQVDADKKFFCGKPGSLLLPYCQYTEIKKDETISRETHPLLILLILFILTVVVVVGGWVAYAYRNPTSPSGLFLIEKCRPWTWRSTTYTRHREDLGESYYMDGGI